jgi:malic enzyme
LPFKGVNDHDKKKGTAGRIIRTMAALAIVVRLAASKISGTRTVILGAVAAAILLTNA